MPVFLWCLLLRFIVLVRCSIVFDLHQGIRLQLSSCAVAMGHWPFLRMTEKYNRSLPCSDHQTAVRKDVHGITFSEIDLFQKTFNARTKVHRLDGLHVTHVFHRWIDILQGNRGHRRQGGTTCPPAGWAGSRSSRKSKGPKKGTQQQSRLGKPVLPALSSAGPSNQCVPTMIGSEFMQYFLFLQVIGLPACLFQPLLAAKVIIGSRRVGLGLAANLLNRGRPETLWTKKPRTLIPKGIGVFSARQSVAFSLYLYPF